MTFARSVTPCAALLLAIVLAGCQKQAETVATDLEKTLCNQAAASALAGKEKITDQLAMQQTGATLVRQIKPGDPVTMDFRQERLTIENDPNSGRIVRASCG
ncbi:I78 family peptidase inhibitor [Brucella pituitosa]|uniref:I78 family peptidase inhibitor n=1 Tax=Brucella pituitosa TaxID=571256 RepID=UPI0009A19D01|nr:I78 family peptidase inhibitor [Brucella pituitosa]